ncbi:LysM peptidoglycan-binding domain-containing protein [Solibacillus sp. FSL H8-0523]|uniref:LysM peptidoglycan-binding domain-containing protein n=1 Tax=Solibacillus sp. FSL H8-0523 TaxID=2954511 RepID=UPI003101A290
MTKEDYREKVEEHRQEIDLHNESGSKLSRASRHQKKGKKKQSNPVMKLLVFILIFIPLSILGYVWLFYEPSASEAGKVAVEDKKDDVVVEIVKQDSDSAKAAAEDNEDKDEKPDAEAVNKSEAEKQRLAAEEAKIAEQKLAKDKDVAEAKKAEEAQKVAAKKAKELEEKKKAEAAASAEQKTHTVQSTDNLYRIAIKYYGDGSPASIAKIKAANNLGSDSISTGQVLIITP